MLFFIFIYLLFLSLSYYQKACFYPFCLTTQMIPKSAIEQVQQLQQGQDYFQKQHSFSLQCGLYSINHLLKKRAYTIKDMEQICYNLSSDFLNPHKHVLGGDYDANVIIIGLQNKGCQCEWVDKRKQFKIDNYLKSNHNKQQFEALGFLVNIPQPKKFYHKVLKISARHWLAIRPYGKQGQFALCDSNQENIKIIENKTALQKHLQSILKNQGQIIFVSKKAKGE